MCTGGGARGRSGGRERRDRADGGGEAEADNLEFDPGGLAPSRDSQIRTTWANEMVHRKTNCLKNALKEALNSIVESSVRLFSDPDPV